MNYNFKNMNKKILIALFAAFISVQVFAQPGKRMEERKDKIESMKIGFITERLDLSPEEAKTFWPVYNQYQKELDDLRKKRREERHDAKQEFENLNDKEVEKVVDGEIAFRQNELDIQKKYHAQFKQVLPVKKVARLYRSEEDFKRELLKKIQDRKEMRGGGPGGRGPEQEPENK